MASIARGCFIFNNEGENTAWTIYARHLHNSAQTKTTTKTTQMNLKTKNSRKDTIIGIVVILVVVVFLMNLCSGNEVSRSESKEIADVCKAFYSARED